MTSPILHWCEACGKEETLTSEQGYEAGWDFPPRIGQPGVISQRTCGNCTIDKTAWFALMKGTKPEDLPQHHLDTISRILKETEK